MIARPRVYFCGIGRPWTVKAITLGKPRHSNISRMRAADIAARSAIIGPVLDAFADDVYGRYAQAMAVMTDLIRQGQESAEIRNGEAEALAQPSKLECGCHPPSFVIHSHPARRRWDGRRYRHLHPAGVAELR